ncbi:hypothetical protein N9I61_01555 [Flavobacteriales bacterium]|nr:hypothetical protein [Flavobacteriales bacterium]
MNQTGEETVRKRTFLKFCFLLASGSTLVNLVLVTLNAFNLLIGMGYASQSAPLGLLERMVLEKQLMHESDARI